MGYRAFFMRDEKILGKGRNSGNLRQVNFLGASMVYFEPHMLHILEVGRGGNCLHTEVLSREQSLFLLVGPRLMCLWRSWCHSSASLEVLASIWLWFQVEALGTQRDCKALL